MAATGRRLSAILIATALISFTAKADDLADIHQCISAVATALSGGDPAQAMLPFSKTEPDYTKLSNYFEALAGAYAVESQIDFTDEELTKQSATITVRWALSLATLQSGLSKNRTEELTLKLAHEGKHWRITALNPIDFFDPQK